MLSPARADWNTDIGEKAQIDDRRVVRDQRVLTRVFYDERSAGSHHVLTEGMGKGQFPPAPPQIGEAAAAYEVLAIGGDQRDEGDRCVEQIPYQAGDLIEPLFVRGFDEPAPPQGIDARGVSQSIEVVVRHDRGDPQAAGNTQAGDGSKAPIDIAAAKTSPLIESDVSEPPS